MNTGKAINAVLKLIVCYFLLFYGSATLAETYKAKSDERLQVKISKSGLNRISNPPYKICYVTGDDSKFRLKYDEDGGNIYLMPLGAIGDRLEISIRNNAGAVQDLELLVSDIRGKSIVIDGKINKRREETEKKDIAEMLRAMKDNIKLKFYVRDMKQVASTIGILKVEQRKSYKYKNLLGGVFEITNPGKERIAFDVSIFAGGFDNLKSFYPTMEIIEPKGTIKVLVVQKIAEK